MKKTHIAIVAAGLLLAASCSPKNPTGKAEQADTTVVVTDSATADTAKIESVVTIIDFYATWCGPCKQQAPILDEVAKEYGNRVKLVRIDIDQDPQKAGQYGVEAVPTLVFESTNGKKEMSVGLKSKSDLEETINALL